MELLYIDDRIIVCTKPPGLLSTDDPGGMPEAIRRELGDTSTSIRSVHRLDRVVGGVMVYARTRRAASELSAQMREGLFHKTYLAVVSGTPETARAELFDWLQRDTRRHKTYVVPEGAENAQEATLSYETLASDEGTALLSVSLHTGRTHQIRCQLSAHGMPIVGDIKYGGCEGPGVALWSHRLSFLHPRTGERLIFSALPSDPEPWDRLIKAAGL